MEIFKQFFLENSAILREAEIAGNRTSTNTSKVSESLLRDCSLIFRIQLVYTNFKFLELAKQYYSPELSLFTAGIKTLPQTLIFYIFVIYLDLRYFKLRTLFNKKYNLVVSKVYTISLQRYTNLKFELLAKTQFL